MKTTSITPNNNHESRHSSLTELNLSQLAYVYGGVGPDVVDGIGPDVVDSARVGPDVVDSARVGPDVVDSASVGPDVVD